MTTILGREPAVFFGLVATAIIAVVNVFIPLDQGTKDGINSVVLFIGPLLVALLTRQAVFSKATVERLAPGATSTATGTADAGDPQTLDVQTSREGEPQG